MKCLLVVALSLMLVGCSVGRSVMPSVSVETVYLSKVRVDSVRWIDSVSQSATTKGDTIFLEKTIVKWRERWRTVTDTFYEVKVDTVVVEKIVEHGGAAERLVDKWGWLFAIVAGIACVVRLMKQ